MILPKTQPKAPEIMLSAFACDPHMGSEPYVGWNWLKLLQKKYNVNLLTRTHHYESLKKACADQGMRVKIYHFDLPGCAGLDHRHRVMKFYYILWHIFVVPFAFYVCARKNIKVIHQCTYNVIDFSGFLWLYPFAKYVWGPIGGGQCPPEWSKSLYGTRWWKQRLRAASKIFIKFNPYIWMIASRSKVILTANEETKARLPEIFKSKCIAMLETAKDPELTCGFRNIQNHLSVIWVGQLESRKGLPIIFDSIRSLYKESPMLASRVKVDVIGTGPLFDTYNSVVLSDPILSNVKLHGSIRFERMREFYLSADVLAFTSVQDTSGNVLLEAMSYGVPIIAINHQGARSILKEGGAIVISPDSWDDVILGFSDGLRQLLTAPTQLKVMAQAALTNLKQNHTWHAKSVEIYRIYDEILHATTVASKN